MPFAVGSTFDIALQEKPGIPCEITDLGNEGSAQGNCHSSTLLLESGFKGERYFIDFSHIIAKLALRQTFRQFSGFWEKNSEKLKIQL